MFTEDITPMPNGITLYSLSIYRERTAIVGNN
jgi:hypothetical protein